MRALVFAESPLQLLNAIEAIHFFKVKNYKIVLRLSGVQQSDSQLLLTLKLLNVDIDLVSIVMIDVKKRNIFDLFKVVFYSKRYLFSKLDFVFIGNADSGFFKQIKKQFVSPNIIYLDDGAKTITLREEYLKKNDLFTIFNVSSRNTFINKYAFLKSIVSKEKYTFQKKEILFLGQKLAEINILNHTQYIALVSHFAKENLNYRITYIAHRGELLSKLDEISQIPNIKVVTLDYPLELYGMFNKKLPFKVVSFYSTALYTMRLIYGVDAECIKIDVCDPKFKKNIDAVYSYYILNDIVKVSGSIN